MSKSDLNREIVLGLRRYGRECPDPALHRSLAEGHLSRLVTPLRGGRGSFWNKVHVSAMQAGIQAFHERAGTLTPTVVSNIVDLGNSSVPILRFAHTPDFLPYVGVLSNLVLIDSLCTLNGGHAIPLALMIDVDTLEDTRLRRARLPGSQPQIWIDTAKMHQRRVAAFAPPPSRNAIQSLLERVMSFARRAGGLAIGLEELAEDIAFAANAAISYGDFSTIIWSRLLNLRAGLGVIFVSQVESATCMRDAIEQLSGLEDSLCSANEASCASLQQKGFSPARSTFSSLSFWRVCRNCGRRESLRSVSAERTCTCGSSTTILVPALAADVLSDWFVWGFSLGSSYPGSASHVLISTKIAQNLGFRDWADVLWAGDANTPNGQSDHDVRDYSRGRVSIASDLKYERFQCWAKAWKNHLVGEGLNKKRFRRNRLAAQCQG